MGGGVLLLNQLLHCFGDSKLLLAEVPEPEFISPLTVFNWAICHIKEYRQLTPERTLRLLPEPSLLRFASRWFAPVGGSYP